MKIKINEQIISELFSTLSERKSSSVQKSYTSRLLSNPELLAKKIGEEAWPVNSVLTILEEAVATAKYQYKMPAIAPARGLWLERSWIE